jgi:hypothetical protein
MSTSESAFVLDLTSTAGRLVSELPASEGSVALHEWSSWLRVRSDITGFVPPTINPADDELTGFVPPAFEDDGLALLTLVRGADSLDGAAIGLFHARLDAQELAQLQATVEGTPWLDLPRPVGGDFNAATISINYQRGSKLIRRSFNERNGNFIEAIAPLWLLLHKVADRANKVAASSLTLTLDAKGDPADPLLLRLTLRLRARGIGHVVLTDPRLPTPAGAPARLRVGIGEQPIDNPLARPQNWFELPLPALEPGAPHTVVLRPNGMLEWTLEWRAPNAGHYLVRASWNDYGGPVEPTLGQTPFMPLPIRGPSSLGSGPYPIRGALFASRVLDLG